MFADSAETSSKELPNTPRAEKEGPDWGVQGVVRLGRDINENLGSDFPTGGRYEQNLVFLVV